MNETLQVSGLRDLARTLTTLSNSMQSNLMRGALRAGQSVFRDEARSRVQGAGAVDTRALLRSIRVVTVRPQKGGRGRNGRGWVRVRLLAGNRLPPTDPRSAFYAAFLEYGTASFYTGTGKSIGRAYAIKPKKGRTGALLIGPDKFAAGAMHPGVKPIRFMRGAFDTRNRQAIEAAAGYLRERLPREVQRMRSR